MIQEVSTGGAASDVSAEESRAPRRSARVSEVELRRAQTYGEVPRAVRERLRQLWDVECFPVSPEVAAQQRVWAGETYWLSARGDPTDIRAALTLEHRPTENGSGYCYMVFNVGTPLAHRRQGYARLLLRGLVRQFQREHPEERALFLDVYPDNLAAISLYSSLGFAPGRRMRRADGTDVRLMWILL